MLDSVNLFHLQGVPTKEILDRQHEAMKQKRQNLRTAIIEGSGMDHIVSCADDLIDTTLEHFKSEESAMDASTFEGVTNHKLMHATMVDTVMKIWNNLEHRKINDAMELMKFFDERLTYHLEFEDGTFGRKPISAD
jgi:hemerythrin-like metal-binding protein